MQTYQGIYENGVVRFASPISIPDQTMVTVTPLIEPDPVLGCNSPELYAALRQRYDTGEHDLAARVDELDP